MKIGLRAFLVFCMPIVFVLALTMQAEANKVRTGAEFYKDCVGCHTAKPKFAGKPVDYLTDKMMYYRDGKFEAVKVKAMKNALARLSEPEIAELAKFINEIK